MFHIGAFLIRRDCVYFELKAFFNLNFQREDSAKRKDSTASSSTADRSNSLSKKSKKSVPSAVGSSDNNEVKDLNAINTSLSSRLSSTGEYIPYSEDYLDQGK